MSLLVLSSDLPPQAVFEPFKQAEFLSQILPAYRKGTICADEIYHLAIYSSPIAACPLYKAKFKSNYRVERFV